MLIKKSAYVVILVSFLGVGFISWLLYFKDQNQQDTVNIQVFPKAIADWSGVDQVISEEDYAILETRNVLARRYTQAGTGRQIDLLIVYSEHNRKVSHPPEICFTGGGLSILESKRAVLNLDKNGRGLEAVRLLMDLKGTPLYSFYWFKVGNSVTSNYWRQQFLIALKIFSGQPHSSALIRLTLEIKLDDKIEAVATAEKFADLVFPAVKQYLP